MVGRSYRCEFKDIILLGVVVELWNGQEGYEVEKVIKIIGQEFNNIEEIVGWLSIMGGIEGKQASNITLVFLELY